MSLWDRTPERRRATAWPPPADTVTAAAADERGGLERGTLYRGVSGVDQGPVPMRAEDVAGLQDPMAMVFFRQGQGPMTLEEVLDGLTRADALPVQCVHLISEAGQITPDEAPELRRDFRFAISRAAPGRDPDLLVSSDPNSVFLQVAASMATPLVAGCVAVLRETLVKNGTPNPSAALLKAMLINGAQDLPCQYNPSEAGTSPNNNSGFGLVNLERSVVLPSNDGQEGFADEQELDQGEERSLRITVPQETGHTLKITLVWTDPPGAALQNDLDLIVRAGGQERHGNMGTDPGFDRVNNVEQVNWKGIPAGDAEVIVRAHRITQFAQPYALAWRVS